MTDLTTTNVFLGIMAVVSLLEAVAVIGLFVAGALVARRLIQAINAVEERQVAPAVARVNGILDDVREVTSAVKADAVALDRTIHRTADIVTRWHAGTRAGRHQCGNEIPTCRRGRHEKRVAEKPAPAISCRAAV